MNPSISFFTQDLTDDVDEPFFRRGKIVNTPVRLGQNAIVTFGGAILTVPNSLICTIEGISEDELKQCPTYIVEHCGLPETVQSVGLIHLGRKIRPSSYSVGLDLIKDLGMTPAAFAAEAKQDRGTKMLFYVADSKWAVKYVGPKI